ncbi:MAG TPA: GatB/YqeY domain-containing protein [Virgibacillus sp.]|nr:GatB/YqeY domain-containing protein [Virgibacillus sp.]
MSLLNQLNQDMKQAMKQKDKATLSVIRMVKTSMQNEAIKLGKEELSQEEELTILTKELKQRKDSLQEFKKANRDDLVENLETEIHILQEYMPEQLTDDELTEIVQEAIEEVGATSVKDMGNIMKIVMPKVKGKADGSRVNKLVKQYIS